MSEDKSADDAMTVDEFFSSEVFLQALEMCYMQKIQQIDDKFSGEEHIFSPEFNRKMEEIINSNGKSLLVLAEGWRKHMNKL
jgi:hypothetical protein